MSEESSKKEETSIEFRSRVMDKISSTFCGAKWYNATIWLDWGKTTSCHHPPPHQIVVKEILKNPSALHNTAEKKDDRKLMLKGERPAGCEYCWKIEDIGPEMVSDRVFKTNIYNEDSLNNLATMNPNEDIDLKTMEVSFDRKCQFACSYCGPTFSTQWATEIKRNGPYKNLTDFHASNYGGDFDHEFPYENSPINPYIMAFWKWWPKLSKSLQELRVTGGEPMLSQDFWELIRFLENSKRDDMHFAVNSNLGLSNHYINKLIESSHKINNFHIYTSCEATYAQAEYIRDGLNYERYKNNIELIAQEGNFKSINIMMTINALSMFSTTDFMNQILKWKKKFGANRPTFTMNLLRFPSFMSVLTLPEHIKETVKHDLKNWLKENSNNPLVLPHEKESVERLINYLHRVQQGHINASSREAAQRDLKTFFEQYDKRRNKSLINTFPKEFTDWYQTIEQNQDKSF